MFVIGVQLGTSRRIKGRRIGFSPPLSLPGVISLVAAVSPLWVQLPLPRCHGFSFSGVALVPGFWQYMSFDPIACVELACWGC